MKPSEIDYDSESEKTPAWLKTQTDYVSILTNLFHQSRDLFCNYLCPVQTNHRMLQQSARQKQSQGIFYS